MRVLRWWGVLATALLVLNPLETVTLAPLETQLLPLSDFFKGTDLNYEVSSGPATLSQESVLLEWTSLSQSPEQPYQGATLFANGYEHYLVVHTAHNIEVWNIEHSSKEKMWELRIEQEIAGAGLLTDRNNDKVLFYYTKSSLFSFYVVRLGEWLVAPVAGFRPLPVSANIKVSLCFDMCFILHGLDSVSSLYFLHHYVLNQTSYTVTFLPTAAISEENMPILGLACTNTPLLLTKAALFSIESSQLLDIGITSVLGPFLSITTHHYRAIIRATEGYWIVDDYFPRTILRPFRSDIVVNHSDNFLIEYDKEGWALFLPLEPWKSEAKVHLQTTGLKELAFAETVLLRGATGVVVRDEKYVKVYSLKVGDSMLAVRGEEGQVQVCAWERRNPAENLCITVVVDVKDSGSIFVKQGSRLLSPFPITQQLYVYGFNTTADFPLFTLISGPNLSFSLSPPSQIPGFSTHFTLSQDLYNAEKSIEVPVSLQGMRIGCIKRINSDLNLILLDLNRTIYLKLSLVSQSLLKYEDYHVIFPPTHSCLLFQYRDLACLTAEGNVEVFARNDEEIEAYLIPGIDHMAWLEDYLVVASKTCIGVILHSRMESWEASYCRESPIVRLIGFERTLVVIRKDEVELFESVKTRLVKIHSAAMPIDYLDAIYEEPYLAVLTADLRVYIYRLSQGLSTLLLKQISLPPDCQYTDFLIAEGILGLHCGHFMSIFKLAAPQNEMFMYRIPIQNTTFITSDRRIHVLNLICDSDDCRISITDLSELPPAVLKFAVNIEDYSLMTDQITVDTNITVSNEAETQVIPFILHLQSTLQAPTLNPKWLNQTLEVPWTASLSLNLHDIFTGPEITFSTNSPDLSITPQINPLCVCNLLKRHRFLPLSDSLVFTINPDSNGLQINLISFATSPCTLIYDAAYPLSALGCEVALDFHLLFTFQKYVFFWLTGTMMHLKHRIAVYHMSLETKEVERVYSFAESFKIIDMHVIVEAEKAEIWIIHPSLWRIVVTPAVKGFLITEELFNEAIFTNIKAISSSGEGENRTIYVMTCEFQVYEMAITSPHTSLHFLGFLPPNAQGTSIYGNKVLIFQRPNLHILSLPNLSPLKVLHIPSIEFSLLKYYSAKVVLVITARQNVIMLDISKPQGSEVIAVFESQSQLYLYPEWDWMVVRNNSDMVFCRVEDLAVGRIEGNRQAEGDYEGNVVISARNSRGTEEVSIRLIRKGKRRKWLWVGGGLLGLGGCYLLVKRKRGKGVKPEIELAHLSTEEAVE